MTTAEHWIMWVFAFVVLFLIEVPFWCERRRLARNEAVNASAQLVAYRACLKGNLIAIRVGCSDVSPLVPVLIAALDTAMLKEEPIDTVKLRDQLEFFQVRRDQDVRNAAVDLLRSEKKGTQ